MQRLNLAGLLKAMVALEERLRTEASSVDMDAATEDLSYADKLIATGAVPVAGQNAVKKARNALNTAKIELL